MLHYNSYKVTPTEYWNSFLYFNVCVCVCVLAAMDFTSDRIAFY